MAQRLRGVVPRHRDTRSVRPPSCSGSLCPVSVRQIQLDGIRRPVTTYSSTEWSGLLRGGPAALPAGLLLLRRRPALAGVAAGAGLLAAVARRVRRVGDAGGALLGHALVL